MESSAYSSCHSSSQCLCGTSQEARCAGLWTLAGQLPWLVLVTAIPKAGRPGPLCSCSCISEPRTECPLFIITFSKIPQRPLKTEGPQWSPQTRVPVTRKKYPASHHSPASHSILPEWRCFTRSLEAWGKWF